MGGDRNVTGTVGHEQSSRLFQSVAEQTLPTSGKSGLHDAARILRSARLRDLLASIAEWERASGPDRTYWRRDALWRLAEWRARYRNPEKRAFDAAVRRARAG